MSPQAILITGGAGYIGGSLVADFTSRASGLIKDLTIYTTVRTAEQAQPLVKAGINAIQLDVNNEGAVKEVVMRHNIDIVINATVGFDPNVASYLIHALGERQKASGKQTYFIQSSVLAIFSAEGGWTYGEVRDTDPILEKEIQMADHNPVRLTNIAMAEASRAHGVKSFVMALPHVYGIGKGEYRKVSVNIPAYVRVATADKVVHKFDKDARTPAVHIDDMVSLYDLLVEHIIRDQPAASNENEYYFVMAHKSSWWEVMDGIAKALYSRGLVSEPKPHLWSTYEEASGKLGFPLSILEASQMSGGDFVPVNPYRIGWKPEWDEKRYLDSIDDEVQAALDFDTIKPTLFNSINDSFREY